MSKGLSHPSRIHGSRRRNLHLRSDRQERNQLRQGLGRFKSEGNLMRVTIEGADQGCRVEAEWQEP